MIHPHTEIRFISDEIGYGVVAKEFIPKGTVTWVQDKLDQVISPSELEQLGSDYYDIIDVYAFRNRDGNYILCWDHARFVNHSFQANCLTTAYDFEIAIRDIHPGEQLTDDYGYLNIKEPFRAISEGTRRKVVYPDDTLRYHQVWDQKVSKAMRQIDAVSQPLGHLIQDDVWGKVRLFLTGKGTLDSILTTYYPG